MNYPVKILKLSIPGAGENPKISQYLNLQDEIFSRWQIKVNDKCEVADAWFVIEDVIEQDAQCKVPRDKVFFGSAETAQGLEYLYDTPGINLFCQQFFEFHTFHQSYENNIKPNFPFLPWMINSNHGISIWQDHPRNVKSLSEIEYLSKDNKISLFCSAQNLTQSHNMRLRFAYKLKEFFGEKLVWYGNGINSIEQKWEGIAPFKYSIVLENQSRYNVVTEKICDAFLGLSYPFYWGAPNVSDIFAEKGYETINIENLSESIKKIEEAIARDLYFERIDFIKKNREIVLNDFNFLKRILMIVERSSKDSGGPIDLILRSKNQCKPLKNRLHENSRDYVNFLSKRFDDNTGLNSRKSLLKIYIFFRYNRIIKKFRDFFLK